MNFKDAQPKITQDGLFADLQQKPQNVKELIAFFKRETNFEKTVEAGFYDTSQIPHPKLLKQCTEMAMAFADCLERKKKILILGDYDVDGVSAVALFARFFKKINYPHWQSFLPNRFTHGYGLNPKMRKDVLHLKPEVIVTVDNGTNAWEEVEFYQNLKILILITDHHKSLLSEELSAKIPYLVNPHQKNCFYPAKEICGTLVVFLFLIELRRVLRERIFFLNQEKEPNLFEDLDLVTLGTLADQMPLVGLNRFLVRLGMQKILCSQNKKRKSAHAYIQKIQENLTQPLRFEDLSFSFLPMLNAAGRIGSAEIALKFLLSTPENAGVYYAELLKNNAHRKNIQNVMFAKAFALAKTKNNNPALAIFDPSFHEGISGIVATKLTKQLEKPVVIFAAGEEGMLKGSCRTPSSMSVLPLLQTCQEWIVEFGGHDHAAGVQIHEKNLPAFQTTFENYKQQEPDEKFLTQTSEKEKKKLPLLLDPKWIGLELLEALKELEPFGSGNPFPTFQIANIDLSQPTFSNEKVQKWLQNGKTSGEIYNLVYFGKYAREWKSKGWNLTGSARLNLFQGKEQVEFLIQSWQESQISEQP